MEVAFVPAALRRLWLLALVAVAGGIVLIPSPYVLFGIEVPPWLRITFGVFSVAMGAWFAYAAAERAGSDDPAIRVTGDEILFHVNPGRRIVLRRDEIRKVGTVREVAQAPQRAILGDRVFEVETTRPEGLGASAILVGSRYVDGELEQVRDRLAAALG